MLRRWGDGDCFLCLNIFLVWLSAKRHLLRAGPMVPGQASSNEQARSQTLITADPTPLPQRADNLLVKSRVTQP
ncbi:hypothetical protein GQ54DRAFT_216964 [Martensiomyces pterosporus]|nr:hypothetical protein GQ54DRAFT_216964 [Martensiomyces pterosporus]